MDMSWFKSNDFLTALSAFLAVPAVMTASFAGGIAVGRLWAGASFNNENRKQQLEHIYAPLVGLLLNYHMTTTGMASRWDYVKLAFRQPLSRFKFSRLLRYLQKAFGPPYFEEEKTYAEVEFGGRFPTDRIKEIVARAPRFADRTLLGKISRAERSYIEREKDDGLLTSEQWALYEYIDDKHEVLCKKLGLS